MRAFGESPPPRSRAPLPQYAARAPRRRTKRHGPHARHARARRRAVDLTVFVSYARLKKNTNRYTTHAFPIRLNRPPCRRAPRSVRRGGGRLAMSAQILIVGGARRHDARPPARVETVRRSRPRRRANHAAVRFARTLLRAGLHVRRVRRVLSRRARARRAFAAAPRDRVRRRSRDAFRLRGAARTRDERQVLRLRPSRHRDGLRAVARAHRGPRRSVRSFLLVRARAPARRTDRANRARHRVRHRHVSEDAQHAASVRHRADRDHADGRRSAAPPRRARAGRDRLHVSNCLAVAAQLPVPAKADLRRAARTARHRRAAARAADRGPPARRSGRACETRPSDRRPPDRRAPPPCGRAPAAARHRSSQRHARRSSTPR